MAAISYLRLALAGAATLCIPSAALAQDDDLGVEETPLASLDSRVLSALSIEELANVTVESASKRPEPLSGAPTALYVITAKQIEDSAAYSLPEALRLAPNLQVQQVTAREYAISARGFNNVESSNKLLVLIDGRTIYTPLHAGVFWDLHNPVIEDIAQIEVISGPGGSLYGPNAVNGVINVISRDARDTIGVLARGTVGANERTAAARYGIQLGEGGAARVYANWFDREDMPAGIQSDGDDQFRGWQAGFRADLPSGESLFTLQGDIFDNRVGSFANDGNRGHNLLARWQHSLDERSSLQVRAYYDKFDRNLILVSDSLETFDVEAQYTGRLGSHEFVVGAGVRSTRDEFINNLNAFKLDPESRRLSVVNLFAQDKIALAPTVSLILGLKAENSTFSGTELLPSARLAWQPDPSHFLWAAVSRAVRTPSRIDRQLVNLPLLAQATEFESEKLIAWEAGYRGQLSSSLNVSVNAFFNSYNDLRSTELAPGGVLPIRLSNGIEGHNYGVEAWGVGQLTPWARLELGVATLWKDFSVKPGRVDLADMESTGDDPNYVIKARANITPTDRLNFNLGVRYVGAIETAPAIDPYVEADAQLAYRLGRSVEVFVAGTNLLHRSHLESNDPKRSQAVERSVFAGTRMRF